MHVKFPLVTSSTGKLGTCDCAIMSSICCTHTHIQLGIQAVMTNDKT